MVFVAELFGSWLFGQVADEGRKRLTTLVLGSDQERALLHVAFVDKRKSTVHRVVLPR